MNSHLTPCPVRNGYPVSLSQGESLGTSTGNLSSPSPPSPLWPRLRSALGQEYTPSSPGLRPQTTTSPRMTPMLRVPDLNLGSNQSEETPESIGSLYGTPQSLEMSLPFRHKYELRVTGMFVN